MDWKAITGLDITGPEEVEIEYDAPRNVLYVHADGITVLRICRSGSVEMKAIKTNHGKYSRQLKAAPVTTRPLSEDRPVGIPYTCHKCEHQQMVKERCEKCGSEDVWM